MVKLILNKKYKTNNPGDLIEANTREEERLINKGMAHYAPKDIGLFLGGNEIIEEIRAYDITDSFTEPKEKKPRKPRKPKKKKAKKFEWQR